MSSAMPAPGSRELPDGTWETRDYIDQDPGQREGLIPIEVKMTIEGDAIHYDLTGRIRRSAAS